MGKKVTELNRREDLRRIEAFGLCLNLMREEDLPLFCEWRNHPEVLPFMDIRKEVTPLHLLFWFNKIVNDQTIYPYIIKENGISIGYIEVKNIDVAQSIAESGTIISPQKMGAGYGLRAFFCKEIILEKLGINTLIAKVRNTNKKSLRYNQFFGFQYHSEEGDRIVLLSKRIDRKRRMEDIARKMHIHEEYRACFG